MPGSQDHLDQYREIHATREWGNTSVKNLRFLRPEIRLLDPGSILDYGCGQSGFLEALGFGERVRLLRYDPAIPDFATAPSEKADLLINIDVLEHVPESDLDDVLTHMASLCRDALIVVDTKPAGLTLPNGQNAHCTLRPHAWWQEKLSHYFGPVIPIRAARRSRAAFRTWKRKPGDGIRFRLMRLVEDTRHFARRIFLGKARNPSTAPPQSAR